MAIGTGLQSQRVLIIGASGGIGDAIAELFSAEGCRLVLHANSRAPADPKLKQ
jgi:NAD(P)-dependent dehydrogenase (short-subunit alcohol dehydrogenase family)